MIVREILTKLGFQVESGKLDKTEQQLEAIKNRLGFLAGAELARGLYELGERFATFAEELHVAAESAGLTVETFQKLTFSARQSAVSTEEMEHSMVRLSRALYNAKTGGAEAQKAFYLAGISQQQIQGFQTAQDALLALSDRFREMRDPVAKAALAQELMGRGSIHMVGYLSQGSAAIRAQGAEAQKLGLIISEGQVNALVKLEHALQKVYALFQAIGARIASYFAPILEYMINDFLRLVSANRGLIELNIENFLKNVAYGLGFVWGVLKELVPLVVNFAKGFHLEGNFITGLAKIAGFATGLLAVAAAFRAIAAAVAFITSPLLLTVASLTAIVASVHDLYAMLKGRPEGELWLNKIGQKLGVGSIVTDASNFLSDKGNEALSYLYSDNSQVNVTVQTTTGASPKEIGVEVSDAIREHHDRKMREAQAGTMPGVVR